MHARFRFICLGLLELGLIAPAFAADVEVVSKIDAVTLYPDAAAVTRVADIDVPPGQTLLVFKGLPLNLDPASLRVGGEATGPLSIGAVESHLAVADAKPDTGIEARLKSLRSEREGWQVTLEALEAKKAMMLRFANTSPENLSSDAKPLTVSDWPAAWDSIGTALAKVGDELRAARTKAGDLDDEIKGLEATRGHGPMKPTPARVVTVAIDAGGAVKGKVSLTYRAAGAIWQPIYDARLETGRGNSSLELGRRAEVTQRTGEDWTDVALTVSTTRAGRGTAAPDIQTRRLDFSEMPNTAAAAGLPRMMQKSMGAANTTDAPAPVAAPPPLQLATQQQASVDADAFQASFKLPGRVSLATDGAPKTFAISSRRLVPELSVKTVPALDATAYLQAHFVNDEDAPLIAGNVELHRDGTYVGSSRIDLVAPGDALDLGFGADDRVKVTRVPVRRKENEPTWFGQTKTETREFKTTVRNLHDMPIRIVVIDQVPISENTAITVETLPTTTPPTEKVVADKRGVMSWTYDYAPNESKDIRLGYRMKWPADREVTLDSVR